VIGFKQTRKKGVGALFLVLAWLFAAIGIEKLIGTRVEAWRASRTKML